MRFDSLACEPLAWFMIKSKKYKYNSVAHARIPMRFCFAVIETQGLLGLEALGNYLICLSLKLDVKNAHQALMYYIHNVL